MYNQTLDTTVHRFSPIHHVLAYMTFGKEGSDPVDNRVIPLYQSFQHNQVFVSDSIMGTVYSGQQMSALKVHMHWNITKRWSFVWNKLVKSSGLNQTCNG